jgi:hypothetical protein
MNKSEIAVPQILYKYYPPERIESVLDEFTVRFSSPGSFNDAFDSISVATAHGRMTDAKQTTMAQIYRMKLGVFCLTEDPNSHLMWVNYAAQHKGFVVAFKTGDEFFSSNGVVPRHVDYVAEPVILPAADELSVQRAFIKSADWEYEHEWRCARQFSNKEARDVVFEPTVINEIIVGWHMEKHQVLYVLQQVDVINSLLHCSITVSESVPDMRSWTFIRRPTTKSVCRECNGQGYVKKE